MSKIFLFNGPAGSGKDTAAMLMKSNHSGEILKFAAPLKRAAAAIYFGGNMDEFNLFDTFEKKGDADPVFFGLSCRQVQINLSENFLKPQHGRKVFGKILASHIQQLKGYDVDGPFFVSDSGFVPEAEVLAREFGPENVTLIRIHREGHTFEGDSRDYIYLDHLGVKSFDIHNDTTVEDFELNLLQVVSNILGVDR